MPVPSTVTDDHAVARKNHTPSGHAKVNPRSASISARRNSAPPASPSLDSAYPNPAEREEWIWGWDPTPGIVSVYATLDGRATVWRRLPSAGTLVREQERFRPWLVLEHLDDLGPLRSQLERADGSSTSLRYQELSGPGELRHFISADDGNALRAAIQRGVSARLGYAIAYPGENEGVFMLPPEEQYLGTSGRTYFRDLTFDDVHRLQFDLETTGLDPRHHRIFLISVRDHTGDTHVLETRTHDDAGEADLIRRFLAHVHKCDPDVIENHNLHGFDLPFLQQRASLLGIRVTLGRIEGVGLTQRAARRGVRTGNADDRRRIRFVAPGRELIDTLDAVRLHDFSARDLPGYGLKAVAKHFGLASDDREYIRGDQIYATYLTDPERVRRYATDDVREVAALSRVLGGAAYALARMAPRRYERLADAGPATGILDPLLVRAYLRAGMALPSHSPGDGTAHTGAALYLFASGVVHRVVKADVASLYPSLMRTYRIGPSRDRLGALLGIVDGLVERRLDAKAKARAAPAGSAERHTHDAMAAALKIVVNSAYGYLGAGELTRFSDVHAANEVTRRGREVLDFLCRELAKRGVALLEADTDGVYFAVPPEWNEQDERKAVSEVAALLPPLIQLEFEGRYAAMLSHEPKNYALLGYDGSLTLRGVAFRSSRFEPFGEIFLRQAVDRLLRNDIAGVRERYLTTLAALQNRALPTHDVSSRVRLTKTPDRYLATRQIRRELPYEALISAGRATWQTGDRIRVYRKVADVTGAIAGIASDSREESMEHDPRDYDVEYYVRLLRTTFAQRLVRAFRQDDFDHVFTDPHQLSLFTREFSSIRTVLTELPWVPASEPLTLEE